MSDKEALDKLRRKHEELLAEVRKVIVGQETVIKEVTMAILAGGHCLLVGVPGLAKTLLVNTVSQALGLSFNRIQFTPDLMPSDITGSEVLNEDRKFEFLKQRKIWCASSTHEGEEKICMDAHKILKKKHKELLTIIIPRHVERISNIIDMAKKENLIGNNQLIIGSQTAFCYHLLMLVQLSRTCYAQK